MNIENNGSKEVVLNNLSQKYQHTESSVLVELSREELICKVIIIEATLEILTENMKALEWENSIWNSSSDGKISRF